VTSVEQAVYEIFTVLAVVAVGGCRSLDVEDEQ
jgi:hypothetical protein